jgi:rSAM/selenodomain-associated transferase 1
MKPTAILMLKAPVPGAVKTRLATDLGPERACLIYRGLVERQLTSIPGDWDVEVCFAPEAAHEVMREWLGNSYRYAAQSEGDLGNRMATAVIRNLEAEKEYVVLLGGDCPYADEKILKQCEELLLSNDVVLGPSLDGGYYLMALKRYVPELFKDMIWSTESVFAETMKRAGKVGIVPALLPTLEDVDDVVGWKRAERSLGLNF